MRACRLARSLLRYWSRVGRLKESVQVVRFRILLRILDRRELLELLVLLELLEMMRSDIALSSVFWTRKWVSSEQGVPFLRNERNPKLSFFWCERVDVQILIGEQFVVELQYIWHLAGVD